MQDNVTVDPFDAQRGLARSSVLVATGPRKGCLSAWGRTGTSKIRHRMGQSHGCVSSHLFKVYWNSIEVKRCEYQGLQSSSSQSLVPLNSLGQGILTWRNKSR